MKFEDQAILSHPLELVFEAFRDRLTELTPYLPAIEAIETVEREELGPGRLRLVNIWHGAGEIPKAARKLLSEKMLSWTDHARWDESKWTCEWRMETHAFTEAVRCWGENHFVEVDPGHTRLEIRGEIEIDMKKVKGVPGFLAGTIGRTVEQFLVKQITPNLTSVSDALTGFLQLEHS